jgi:methionyl-tRNA formyltransferase
MEPVPQQGEPTYAEKLSVDEFRVDPRRAAADLARLVRAGNPRPGAWMVVRGKRVKVWRAHPEEGDDTPGSIRSSGALTTADGALRLDEVQPEGRARMSAEAWLTGMREGVVMVEPV